MTQTSRKLFTQQSVANVVNNRRQYGSIGRSDVGKRLIFTIVNAGNDIDVSDKSGQPVMSAQDPTVRLRKRIWNVNCINEIAENSPLNIAILKAGVEAEMAGDYEKADELYNEFLNKVTISVGLLHPISPALSQLTRGDQIKGTVILLTAEKDGIAGDLLTLDPKTLGAMPVMSAAKPNAPKLTIEDLLGVKSTAKTTSAIEG